MAENPLYKRMRDCEIVLRYFAFSQPNLRGSVRSILDKYMKDALSLDAIRIAELEATFRERIEVAHEIFGAHTFRYRDTDGHWTASVPVYDAVMVALDRLWPNRQKLVGQRAKVAKAVTNLFGDPETFALIVGRPNTAKAIANRIAAIHDAMASAIRV